MKELGDVLEVGKGRRKSDKTNVVVRLFHSTNRTGDDGFEDGTTLVVEEMNLVDDDKADEVGVTRIRRLASDNVPLLRSSNDNLSLGDLLLRELTITGEFVNDDVERLETGREVADHFLDEGFHRSDVDDLEGGEVELACARVAVLGELVEDREHGDVGLCVGGWRGGVGERGEEGGMRAVSTRR
jgi:hypothetical protein